MPQLERLRVADKLACLVNVLKLSATRFDRDTQQLAGRILDGPPLDQAIGRTVHKFYGNQVDDHRGVAGLLVSVRPAFR